MRYVVSVAAHINGRASHVVNGGIVLVGSTDTGVNNRRLQHTRISESSQADQDLAVKHLLLLVGSRGAV